MAEPHDFQADGPGIVGSDICTVCGKEREDHEPCEWLIRKDGYYYRPNCRGYTTSKFEAGRYTKSMAEAEAAVEPWHMKAVHQDDVEDDPTSARVRMDADRIATLKAENERLTDLIRWANDTLYEISPSNYDHDEVCKLNDASVEVILGLSHHLGERHGKSEQWWKEHLAKSSVPRADAAGYTLAERAGGVKVLEWRGIETVWLKADAEFGGMYRITVHAGVPEPFKLEIHGCWDRQPCGRYATLNAAKAAAQDDYERRILSTLTTEPAAPEGRQETVAFMWPDAFERLRRGDSPRETAHAVTTVPNSIPLYTRPAEQAVTDRKFALGDRVTKLKGSSWTGRVVGFYSTALTPIGYAVESDTETGSVQIYPEAALRRKA